MVIKAAYPWANNAELIADVHRLGYIGEQVLDTTYGLGRFWTEYRPKYLVENDAHPDRGAIHHDFTSFPDDWGDRFDTTVYDPPYKLNGTPTLGKMDEDYGVENYTKVGAKIDLILNGAIEALRVTKPGGTLLVKIQDQVSSGRMYFLSDMIRDKLHGAKKIAVFHLLTNPRPQPPGRSQKHARNNYSTLLVFRKY